MERVQTRLGVNYYEKLITMEIVQLNYNYMAFKQSN